MKNGLAELNRISQIDGFFPGDSWFIMPLVKQKGLPFRVALFACSE